MPKLLPTIRGCKGLCVFFDFASGDGTPDSKTFGSELKVMLFEKQGAISCN
jgi:hypothetical protein